MAKNENTEAAEETKAPKIALVEQNGVTQPREGSKTRRVWDIATEIGEEAGRAPTAAEVLERAEAEGLNKATVQTQYNRFRRFYGLPPQGRKPKVEETETEKTAAE